MRTSYALAGGDQAFLWIASTLREAVTVVLSPAQVSLKSAHKADLAHVNSLCTYLDKVAQNKVMVYPKISHAVRVGVDQLRQEFPSAELSIGDAIDDESPLVTLYAVVPMDPKELIAARRKFLRDIWFEHFVDQLDLVHISLRPR